MAVGRHYRSFFWPGVLILVGIFVRLRVTETPVFTEAVVARGKIEKNPAWQALRRHPRNFLVVLGARLAENGLGYFFPVFGLSYVINTLGVPKAEALSALMLMVITGVGFLIHLQKKLNAAGCELVLIASGLIVQRALALMSLDDLSTNRSRNDRLRRTYLNCLASIRWATVSMISAQPPGVHQGVDRDHAAADFEPAAPAAWAFLVRPGPTDFHLIGE